MQADRIRRTAQDILVKSLQEAGIRAAGADLEILLRTKHDRVHHLDGSAGGQEIDKGVETARIRSAMEESLISILNRIDAEFLTVDDGLGNLHGVGRARVQQIGPGGQAAGVRRPLQEIIVSRYHEGLVRGQGALQHRAVFQAFDVGLGLADRPRYPSFDQRRAHSPIPVSHGSTSLRRE